MDAMTFQMIAQDQFSTCLDVLVAKADEYATEDRLHNFRVAADLQDVTLAQALVGMMAKHTVSIYDLVRTDYDLDSPLWPEKITDHINYLILLKAAYVERAQHLQLELDLDAQALLEAHNRVVEGE